MARTENCVLTNMCMVYDGERILVQERVDPDWSGIVFPGGHVEKNESFVESVVREVKEETGLDIENVRLCGVKQWTHREGLFRYIVLLFRTDKFSGELKSSDEGRVFWIKRGELENYTLAEGFKEMLEVFENEDLSETYYRFENGVWLAENK